MTTHLCLVLLSVLSAAGVCSGTSAPGEPRLLSCRSPEKETFACWWEPGSDGGLPTEYRLYYSIENSEVFKECPDYVSAGQYSCYFDKKHTNIWAEYNMKVMAINAAGNATLDFSINDVVKYVKPDPPVNVTVLANTSAPSPYLQINWKSPPNADTKSGWVTAKYELRFKQNDSGEWKNLETGEQNSLKLFDVNPGALYMVQVRCKLDHSNWSDWSGTSFAKIPKYSQTENPFWILVFVFSLIPLLAIIGILVLKRKLLKQLLLPPVPGPKIRGVDVLLLKSGRSEEVVNALLSNQKLPPMTVWTTEVEDYLMVSDSKEWLLTDHYTSQKNEESLIAPAGLHLTSEIQHGESTPALNALGKAEDSQDEMEHFESSTVSQLESSPSSMKLVQPFMEKRGCPSIGEAASTKAIQPLADTSYVDIPQPKNFWEADYSRVKEVNGETILLLNSQNVSHVSDALEQEVNREVSVPDDYSRVKEVNDVIFLQKQDLGEYYCRKKEDHYSNKKSAMPHESTQIKGLCSEIIGNGYVDSVPTFPVK